MPPCLVAMGARRNALGCGYAPAGLADLPGLLESPARLEGSESRLGGDVAQLVPAGGPVSKACAAGEGGDARPRDDPEQRASDLADVATFDEFKRLSRKYPKLRDTEVWPLVGKSDAEIAS